MEKIYCIKGNMTVPRYIGTYARPGTTGTNILDINACAVLLKEVHARGLEPGETQGMYQAVKHTWGWQHWNAESWPRGQRRDGKEIRLQADTGMAWLLLPIIWHAQLEGVLWLIYSSTPLAVLRGMARQKQVREVQRKQRWFHRHLLAYILDVHKKMSVQKYL